jgi:hypothetical protein
MFATKAATYMGVDVKTVLATEAETYEGQAAVDVGFANEVVNGLDAVQIMSDHFKRNSTTVDMGAAMSVVDPTTPSATQQPSATAPAPQPAASAQDSGATVTDQPAAESAPAESQDAQANAAQAERDRCMGILALPEAEGRQEMAMHLASKTSLSVDEAKNLLAAAPQGTKDANATALAALSAEHGELLGQDVSTGSASEEQKNISRLAASFQRID